MAFQIDPTIVNGAIAAGSAAAGYAFREWRNHSRPFIAITGFSAGSRRAGTEVNVADDIVKNIAGSFHLGNLTTIDTLANIGKVQQKTEEIVERAPKIVRRIESFLEAARSSSSGDHELCNPLADLFEPNYMDYYLALLLTRGRVQPAITPESLPDKIAVHLSADNAGCVLVNFPGRPLLVGMDFDKDHFLEQSFRPLITSIRKLDRDGLATTLQEVKRQINAEVSIAKDSGPKLEKILEDYSLWEVEVFFGNLRSTPILLETSATLNVRDKLGARFREVCDMAVNKEAGGKMVKRAADSPLIVKSGDYQSFSFFTRKTQREMERGQAFRESFGSNQAVAWLELRTRSVGLIERRVLKTSQEQFKE
jgi:hypothetical protein